MGLGSSLPLPLRTGQSWEEATAEQNDFFPFHQPVRSNLDRPPRGRGELGARVVQGLTEKSVQQLKMFPFVLFLLPQNGLLSVETYCFVSLKIH